MDVFGIIGKKTVALETLNEEYDRLLSLLSRVLKGEVEPSQVTVDLPGRKWELRDIEPPASADPLPEPSVAKH